jgi:hypothetical protein
VIWTKRIDLADDLWRFGEEALAEQVADEGKVTAAQLERIGEAASRYSLDERYASPSGKGMMISKALAHGAVEVLEGQERSLARSRRRPGPSPYAPVD